MRWSQRPGLISIRQAALFRGRAATRMTPAASPAMSGISTTRAAGLAYEVHRFSARPLKSAACRMLIKPGLWLQRITTKEPDDTQLEVAIVALKTALAYDVIEPAQAAVA